MVAISRRRMIGSSIVVGMAVIGANQLLDHSMNQEEPVALGNGIEVRDFRLFPASDTMRFIVEVHNTTDFAVDTPTLGVLLPHFHEKGTSAWADPIVPVLHPHTSGSLLGVAPSGLTSDDDWGTPEWVLCTPVRTQKSDMVNPWSIDISRRLELHDSTHLEVHVEVTNKGHTAAPLLWYAGLLWDRNNRICGTTYMAPFPALDPGSTANSRFWVAKEVVYKPNPFTMIDSVDGVDVTMSLQPGPVSINFGCPPVMPWNQ